MNLEQIQARALAKQAARLKRREEYLQWKYETPQEEKPRFYQYATKQAAEAALKISEEKIFGRSLGPLF